jgi:hypothetical protein
LPIGFILLFRDRGDLLFQHSAGGRFLVRVAAKSIVLLDAMLLAIDIIWLLTVVLLLVAYFNRREPLRNLFLPSQRWAQVVQVVIMAVFVGSAALNTYERMYGPGRRSIFGVPITALAGLPLAVFICVRLFCLYVMEKERQPSIPGRRTGGEH